MGDGINGPSPGAKTKPDVAQTEYISVSLSRTCVAWTAANEEQAGFCLP